MMEEQYLNDVQLFDKRRICRLLATVKEVIEIFGVYANYTRN
jgi:hypothetical protein